MKKFLIILLFLPIVFAEEYVQKVNPLNNIFLTFFVSILPIIILFSFLVFLKLPAWKSSIIASFAAFLLAVFIYSTPFNLALNSFILGMLFGLLYVAWLVFWAITFFNVWKNLGFLDAFKDFILKHSTKDIRFLALLLAFALGALIEGIAGFGTPWAYIAPILVSLGLSEIKALTAVAIANTAPVSFGAFGLPIITLAGVTNLPLHQLGICAALTTIIEGFFVSFLILYLIDGKKGLKEAWPYALVAASSYSSAQFLTAYFLGPYLPDVIGAFACFIALILFSKIWKPKNVLAAKQIEIKEKQKALKAILSLGIFILVLAIWHFPIPNSPSHFSLFTIEQKAYSEILNKEVSVKFSFNPFCLGTGALIAFLISLAIMKPSKKIVFDSIKETIRKIYGAIITSLFVFGLAYLYNFSGFSYSLAYIASFAGIYIIFIAPFIGGLGAALTGSNTSSNAIFGPFQAATGKILNLPPLLLPIANSIGAELSKPIAIQTVSVGVTTSSYIGKEGEIIKINFIFSMFLLIILTIVMFLLYKFLPYPFMIK